MQRCGKCGSESVVPHARITDRPGSGGETADLKVTVIRNRQALFFEKSISGLKATVCGACGFVELYAKEPGSLWDAYLEDERTKDRS